MLHKIQPHSDHAEQLWRSLSSVTFAPLKSSISFFIPFFHTWTSKCIAITPDDPVQEAMMPQDKKTAVLEELDLLKSAAKLNRKVNSYIALSHSFLSCGGSLSLTSPVLCLPTQHIFRPEKSCFSLEKPEDRLDEDIWRFSDNEVRFFIARELSHIKKNDALLRLAAKISIVAGFALLCIHSLTPWGSALLLTATISSHLLLERHYQGKMDLSGVEVLSHRLGDPHLAQKAALSSLEKLKKQNLQRPRFYITKAGDNRLDFNHPPLTRRIEALRESILPQNRHNL